MTNLHRINEVTRAILCISVLVAGSSYVLLSISIIARVSHMPPRSLDDPLPQAPALPVCLSKDIAMSTSI